MPSTIKRGQYKAIYQLNLLPSGDHAGPPRKIKSSGLPAYELAVESAIRRCDPVRVRPGEVMPRSIELVFDPVDDADERR